MAAGCKPAAPWSYGGSNPPLSTRFGRLQVKNRFAAAMVLYALIALIAVATLSDQKILGVTLLLLAMFAVRTWVHQRRQSMEDQAERQRELEKVKLGRT